MSEQKPDNLTDIVAAKWREMAACANEPTRWFFPKYELVSDLGVRHARIICAGCPVKVPCLERAITGSMPGIYSGTDQAQRRPFIRRARDEEARPAIIAELLEIAKATTVEGEWRVGLPEDWMEAS